MRDHINGLHVCKQEETAGKDRQIADKDEEIRELKAEMGRLSKDLKSQEENALDQLRQLDEALRLSRNDGKALLATCESLRLLLCVKDDEIDKRQKIIDAKEAELRGELRVRDRVNLAIRRTCVIKQAQIDRLKEIITALSTDPPLPSRNRSGLKRRRSMFE